MTFIKSTCFKSNNTIIKSMNVTWYMIMTDLIPFPLTYLTSSHFILISFSKASLPSNYRNYWLLDFYVNLKYRIRTQTIPIWTYNTHVCLCQEQQGWKVSWTGSSNLLALWENYVLFWYTKFPATFAYCVLQIRILMPRYLRDNMDCKANGFLIHSFHICVRL